MFSQQLRYIDKETGDKNKGNLKLRGWYYYMLMFLHADLTFYRSAFDFSLLYYCIVKQTGNEHEENYQRGFRLLYSNF